MQWVLVFVSVMRGAQGPTSHIQTIQAFETEALCKTADQLLTFNLKQSADHAKITYSFNFICIQIK